MNKIFLLLFVSTTLILTSCTKKLENNNNIEIKKISKKENTLTPATQADINFIAQTLQLKYHLITNVPDDKCDSNQSNGACFTVELSFTSAKAITAKDWQITFSQISPIQSYRSEEFSITHLNGDLHRISLSNKYSGFKRGESKSLIFNANFWMLSETDALPNYIVSGVDNINPHLIPRVIASTRTQTDKETKLEKLPFVEPFTDNEKQFKRSSTDKTVWLKSNNLFQRNQKLGTKLLPISTQIIPTPTMVIIDQQQRKLNMSNGIKINYGNVIPKTVNAAINHLSVLGIKNTNTGVSLNLTVDTNMNQPKGSYQLKIFTDRINITGVDPAGVFYGLSSLSSLIKLNTVTIPLLTVNDQPHFQFRGMLVDVARNFHSKDFILKLLDQMASYKMNKLHLHLADDEGWRIEIPALPELTNIGSKRCLDPHEQICLLPQLGAGVDSNSAVNGYYSVADYQEILRAASARHIQVIPSIDMPGHARAAIKSMSARYNKYAKTNQMGKAKQYLLNDPNDLTQYSSVQYYNDNTLNVCLESTYNFIKTIMLTMKKIHADAGQPLTRYHIGADETAGAWLQSPACKEFVANKANGINDINKLGAYFITRVAKILTKLNIEIAGWSDGLAQTNPEKMPSIVQANAWDVLFWNGHKKVHQLANRNWQIVISTPDVTYFDFPYEADPKEPGFYWASRHTNTEKVFQFMPDNLPAQAEFWQDRQQHPYQADDRRTYNHQGKLISAPLNKGIKFIGIQGQLWSENTRTDTMAEYKIFPRLLALAERGWHLADWAVPYNYDGALYDQNSHYFTTKLKNKRDLQWRLFANTLGQKELAKLEKFKINYRLPTVGATIKKSLLYANIAFPGIIIEYQQQGQPWQTYHQAVAVKGQVSIRSRSFNGLRHSRSTVVTPEQSSN